MSSSPLDSSPAPRPSRPPRIARIALSTPGAGPARLPRYAILAGVALALLVPLVIALMWFALSYTGYVMAHPIVWQTPVDAAAGCGLARWHGEPAAAPRGEPA